MSGRKRVDLTVIGPPEHAGGSRVQLSTATVSRDPGAGGSACTPAGGAAPGPEEDAVFLLMDSLF